MKLRYADFDQEPGEGQRVAFYMNDRLFFLTGIAEETETTVTFRNREVIAADDEPANTPPEYGDTTMNFTVKK